MSIDRRELVLERLTELLAEMSGLAVVVRGVFRGIGDLPPGRLPALVVLDASEIAREDVTPSRGLTRTGPSPSFVDMTPELYVVTENRPAGDQTIGPYMNALRVAIVRSVLNDGALVTILGNNGRMRYAGCVTDLATGMPMLGEMSIRITFTYMLRPSEL